MTIKILKDKDLFDFHCHLDLNKNYPFYLKEIEKNGLLIVGVTTTPLAWNENHLQSQKHDFIIPALGMHPQLIQDRIEDYKYLKGYFSQTNFIGEIGLDNSPNFTKSFQKQCEVFEEILKFCQNNRTKILSVHSYKAVHETLNYLFKYRQSIIPILHWFTGSLKESEIALKIGCYFSVNLSMIRTSKGRELIKNLPKERILTESDSPFTKESQNLGFKDHIETSVKEISKLWDMDFNSTKNLLKENAISIISKVF